MLDIFAPYIFLMARRMHFPLNSDSARERIGERVHDHFSPLRLDRVPDIIFWIGHFTARNKCELIWCSIEPHEYIHP